MSDQVAVKKVVEEQLKQAYIDGLKDGVRRFAWWKNGVQYVGSCGTTLEAALKEIDKEAA